MKILKKFSRSMFYSILILNFIFISGGIKVQASDKENVVLTNNELSETNFEMKYNDSKKNKTSSDENKSSQSQNGWQKKDNKWYYYDKENKKKTGWIKPDNSWYYLNSDGEMTTGWQKINYIWYHLSSNGAMDLGWKYINGAWYYLEESGAMATGWKYINGSWYYLEESGAMVTGWKYINDSWYYLESNGTMAVGWVEYNDSYYYLDYNSGKMLSDTVVDGYDILDNGKRGSKEASSSSVEKGLYKGIDISNYQSSVDFNKVKNDGIQVVYIKATEGTTFTDPYLDSHYNGAKSAGLKTGFYHFLVGTSSPETQAENFYNAIKNKDNDLLPCLDIENSNFDVMDYTVRFINKFKEISSMNICIYTYSGFISNFDSSLSNYKLWEANFNNDPFNLPSNNIWANRAGHQYSEKGRVNGIDGNVDMDEFNQDIFNK